MRYRLLGSAFVLAIVAAASVTAWIAFPTNADLKLTPPLTSLAPSYALAEPYAKDFKALSSGFTPQKYRSFCGPASISTVLRAFGNTQVDQTELFPSIGDKLDVFYSGMSLAELHNLQRQWV